MFARKATLPGRSFFLFGPRGTGKTTWLRRVLADARWYDLLDDREVSRLARDPDLLRAEIEAPGGKPWVVIDEVQRLPRLLDVVQGVLTRRPGRCRFALSGSSAHRLKREGANLLPARVVNRKFFPLTAGELGDSFRLDRVLRYGGLPAVQAEERDEGRVDLLEAYAANYVAQEVRIEASVRNLHSFARFLDVAALANGQVTNVSGIARDAAVSRTTVQGYFDTLVDTLIGVWLPAWRPRAKVKEVQHPKFYFFDPGVVRAIAGRLREPVDGLERGALLETWVLHELRAYMDRASLGGDLSYWRTPSGTEVDFLWKRAGKAVAMECKAAGRWRPEFGRGLAELAAGGHVRRAFGIYLGDRALRFDRFLVLPVTEFLARLAEGEVLG
ncbi:MAG: ATP-binding protein [Planctomycetes bacterium]|nr:ATP-binding protein [Planctomycetota bacterium]